jgi:hypothetical protein
MPTVSTVTNTCYVTILRYNLYYIAATAPRGYSYRRFQNSKITIINYNLKRLVGGGEFVTVRQLQTRCGMCAGWRVVGGGYCYVIVRLCYYCILPCNINDPYVLTICPRLLIELPGFSSDCIECGCHHLQAHKMRVIRGSLRSASNCN